MSSLKPTKMRIVSSLWGFILIVGSITPHARFLIAQRRRQGVDIYAWSRDDTRGLERSTILYACRYPAI